MAHYKTDKTKIYDEEYQPRYVEIGIMVDTEELERFYDLAALARRINPKSEYHDVRRVIEWTLFLGQYEFIESMFQTMCDAGDISDEQLEAFQQKWETADYDTRQNLENWG